MLCFYVLKNKAILYLVSCIKHIWCKVMIHMFCIVTVSPNKAW